jgi:hypothetical protein
LTRPSQTDPIHRLAVRSATLADFVGITGRLHSEWVAGFDRNQRPTSSECAEAQFLASFSAPAGQWQSNGYGISRVADEHPSPPVAQTTGPKCWYVLDVQLCE